MLAPIFVEIVVARYAEDIDWLFADIARIHDARPDIRITVHVYNKGSIHKKHSQLPCIIENLPNIGREAHTYLYHIIKSYERYSVPINKVVLFLQGRIDDHLSYYRKKTTFEFLLWSIDETHMLKTTRAAALVESNFSQGFTLGTYANYSLKPTGLTFGDWMTRFVVSPFPNPITWWVGALFGVQSHILIQKPIQEYITILDQFTTVNEELAHFCERAWFYMIQPEFHGTMNVSH